MPKFHFTRTYRTYETLLLSGERTGKHSDVTHEGNVVARTAEKAEAQVRAADGPFRIDEVLNVSVRPFEEWFRERENAARERV